MRASIKPLAVVLGIGLTALLLSAAGEKKSDQKARHETVLMIGDSLAVGKFGEVLGNYLIGNYRPESVGFYASCGSSPENWLGDEPNYRTKCGYREWAMDHWIVGDPMTHNTPKLERLIAQHKPTIIIIQQGTNWMDRSLSDEKISSFINRILSTAHRGAKREVVWIGPPDSSRFSKAQDRVYRLIKQQAEFRGNHIIDSRRLTRPYVVGKTGRDGVHYNHGPAESWARGVIDKLDGILPKNPKKP